MKPLFVLLLSVSLWGVTPKETEIQPLGPSDVTIEMAKSDDLLLTDLVPDPPAAGDITAMRVVGAITGVTDAHSACNNGLHPTCSSWVGEIDVAGLSTGGTYTLGYGASGHDPSTAKIVCTVTGSGYDNTGTLQTGQTRTIYGTHQLRRVVDISYYTGGSFANGIIAPFPNDETVVGGTLTLRIAFSDNIYSGETMSCNVAAGIYTQGGTPTNSASSVVVTNNSTFTYSQARVIANWSYPGWGRVGNTLVVRAVGYQRHGQNGKPLAAMKFLACDGTVSVGGACSGHQATAVVTDMTIDGTMGDLGGKVQEYIGTLNLTGFTQGALVRTDFIGYPWTGDATSTMDTTDGVNTQPTPLYAPQFYVFDAAGTYGAPVSVVDGSINVPGVVTSGSFIAGELVTQSTSTATAHLISVPGGSGPLSIGQIESGTVAGTVGLTWTGGTSSAVFTQTVFTVTTNTNTTASVGSDSNTCAAAVGTDPATLNPCATIKQAAIQTRAKNVALNAAAHSDVNGTMYLKAGYYQFTGVTTSVTASTGTTADTDWLTITHYPGLATSDVQLMNTTTSGNRAGAATVKQHFLSIGVNFTSGAPAISAGLYGWLDKCNLIQTVGSTMLTGTANGLAYYTQNTTGTGGAKIMAMFSGSVFPTLVRGNDVSTMTTGIYIYTMLGNLKNSPNGITTGTWQENSTVAPFSSQPIFAYNKTVNFQVTAAVFAIFSSQTSPIGAAIVGNLLEANGPHSNQTIAYTIGTNGGAADNVMDWNNTYTGGRIFHAYNDDTSPPDFATGCYMRSLWSGKGNIWESIFTKTDVFGPNQNAARVCNWAVLYGVGFAGNYDPNDAATPPSSDPVGFAKSMNQEWTGLYTVSTLTGNTIDAQANAQPATVSPLTAVSVVGWVNRQAFDGLIQGTGNGNYNLNNGSPAASRIHAGFALLPFDLAGTARKNDGTGAAGAFEVGGSPPPPAAVVRLRLRQ